MIYEQTASNRLYLSGEIVSEPVFSHEIYGESFYEMSLSVARLSQQCDILPVTVSERLIEGNSLRPGMRIALSGQFRSYNKIESGKSRLMLSVFAWEVLPVDEHKNPNSITLMGYICKPPVYRTTPFAREIADLLLAVNRAYNKSDYIPCIAWGRNARAVRGTKVGEKITVEGRIQSREYQKRREDGELETKVAYEVSVSKITLTGESAAAEDGEQSDPAPEMMNEKG